MEKHRVLKPGETRKFSHEPPRLCMSCRTMKKPEEYAFKAALRCKTCDKSSAVATRLRGRLSHLLKANGRSKRVERYLGCTIDQLRKHIEDQFSEGMSWDNRSQWHIDHIIPVCRFDHNKEREIMKCWHYSNLRPLWAHLNLKKHAKLNSGI